MMKKFVVKTEYYRVIEAENKENAEMVAMDELCKMDGLGGNWIWNENVEGKMCTANV